MNDISVPGFFGSFSKSLEIINKVQEEIISDPKLGYFSKKEQFRALSKVAELIVAEAEEQRLIYEDQKREWEEHRWDGAIQDEGLDPLLSPNQIFGK